MKALLVGDIHLCDRPPSLRKPGYAEQILDKLVYTSQVAHDESVDAVIWAGDVFHVKSPSRTSHRLVQQVIEIGNSYQCAWYIVPGNHDVTHDRMESLDNQPLGVLFKAGAYPLIGDIPMTRMFGVPWLQSWDQLGTWMGQWQESEASLLVTHAPIFPPGQSVPYEFIDAGDYAKMMDRPGDVYYGHIHDTHGTYEVTYQKGSDGDLVTSLFCNQGALSRGSLHESTLKRKPAVTIYDSTKKGKARFRRIEVPHYPVEEVFSLEVRKEAESQQQRLSDFLASVGTTELQQFDVATVLAHIDTLELKPRTRQQIEEVLEVAVNE